LKNAGLAGAREGARMSSPYITEQFPPIAYRVRWRHYSAKLVSATKQSEAYRDFATPREAEVFAQSMRASYPYSVVSTKPLHITHRKREARYDARQRSIDEIVALPLQRKPKR
jgi:hypothetical protein